MTTLIAVLSLLFAFASGFCIGWDERGMRDAENEAFARIDRILKRAIQSVRMR